MKRLIKIAVIAVAVLAFSACCNQKDEPVQTGLVIEKQGVFSSGGRVTDPIPGDYDPTQNWMDATRKGTTTHVDHANTFYQIPASGNGIPMVFLHGYGQTRTGWQATPDGREGWSDPGDVEDGKFKVGEQAWYTHFRIGRVAPERYEGSQFPAGDEAQTQFFCQMTPNTGNYDEPLFGQAMSAVMSDVQKMTGKKAVYITHSQGGRVGWQTDTENIAAIVAIEPGFAPMVGSPEYQKFVEAKVPMLFLFGDNIMNGPEDIQSTGFWQMVLNQCRDFAEHYNQDGGDATVVHLPDMGIKGNSHFMFQEMNNAEIADLVAEWLNKHNL